MRVGGADVPVRRLYSGHSLTGVYMHHSGDAYRHQRTSSYDLPLIVPLPLYSTHGTYLISMSTFSSLVKIRQVFAWK